MKKKILSWGIVAVTLTALIVGIKIYKAHEEEMRYAKEIENRELNEVWTTELDIESLKKYNKPILIDFTAEWCVPCRTFNPLLEKTKEELGEEVIIKIVDADKNLHISSEYPIRVIPSQILITSKGEPFIPDEDLGIFGFKGYSLDDSGQTDLTMHEGPMTEEQLKRLLKAMGE